MEGALSMGYFSLNPMSCNDVLLSSYISGCSSLSILGFFLSPGTDGVETFCALFVVS